MNLKKIIESDPTLISVPTPIINVSVNPKRWQHIHTIHPIGDPDLLNASLTYAPQLIGALDSWHLSKGSGVTVAVLDSGIDLTHEEFTGRVIPGVNFTESTSITGSDEAFSSDVTDDNGHGTHIAGIIGAAFNNFIGAAGIAPECTLLPIKILDQHNSGSWGELAAGIYYAVDHGADIINISAGSFGRSEVAEEAIAYATEKGVLLVAAAGNFGSDDLIYPAAYEDVIAVSATTSNDTLWHNSNYGDYVTVSAPGDEIWSTFLGNGWRWMSGTSMATPHVVGLAALLRSASPGLSSSEIRQLIIESAVQPYDTDFSPQFGYGRIDVYQAFQELTSGFSFSTPTTHQTYFPFVSRGQSTRHIQDNPRPRVRELGFDHWQLLPGKENAITDVAGVRVGHTTIAHGHGALEPGKGPARTGITAILPHCDNLFHRKVRGAVHTINGFGKACGFEEVRELGVIEAPIALTNTLNVWQVADAVAQYAVRQSPEIGIHTSSVNVIVGECNDSYLNDMQGRHVQPEHVWSAIENAAGGAVDEGSVGAGTGTSCFGWKGGIGTASRKLPPKGGNFTVGALVQSNFGRPEQLIMGGVHMGRYLHPKDLAENEEISISTEDNIGEKGSIMIVLATDAPLNSRQLHRLCVRAAAGIARTGSHIGHGSGDFVIAFSTAHQIEHSIGDEPASLTKTETVLADEPRAMYWLLPAVVEAVEEAVLNSLCRAQSVQGRDGHVRHALPVETVRDLMNVGGSCEIK